MSRFGECARKDGADFAEADHRDVAGGLWE
jgi:hypothetical protein